MQSLTLATVWLDVVQLRFKLLLGTLHYQKLFVYNCFLTESFWVFLVSILKPKTLISKSNLQVHVHI